MKNKGERGGDEALGVRYGDASYPFFLTQPIVGCLDISFSPSYPCLDMDVSSSLCPKLDKIFTSLL